MVLGDFNGHISHLGQNKTSKNGKLLTEFINQNNMILLNKETICKGTITWQQGRKKAL